MIEGPTNPLEIAGNVLKVETIHLVNKTKEINRRGMMILDRWSMNEPAKLKVMELNSSGLMKSVITQQRKEAEVLESPRGEEMLRNGLAAHEVMEMYGVSMGPDQYMDLKALETYKWLDKILDPDQNMDLDSMAKYAKRILWEEGPTVPLEIAGKVLKMETLHLVNKTKEINAQGMRIMDLWALYDLSTLKAMEFCDQTKLLKSVIAQQRKEAEVLESPRVAVLLRTGLTVHQVLEIYGVSRDPQQYLEDIRVIQTRHFLDMMLLEETTRADRDLPDLPLESMVKNAHEEMEYNLKRPMEEEEEE